MDGPHPHLPLARTAGCAAKIGQADLRAALAALPGGRRPARDAGRARHRRRRGGGAAVRGAIWRWSRPSTFSRRSSTTPIDYGRIAAANALSDIYAMGARPLNALSFIAWPIDTLGSASIAPVLAGASAICAEARIAISGGHSIIDEEPKFGLFVTGLVHPQRIVTNAGARAGDVLVLTKQIGTGVLTTAAKRGRLPEGGLAAAVRSMASLNRAAAEAMDDRDPPPAPPPT